MPKTFHRVLYNIDQIQLLKADEHHLNANEAFLLELLQDTVSELRVLKEEVRILRNHVNKGFHVPE